MTLRKGYKLKFKNHTETILSASNNRITGEVKTDKQTYSTDFIFRWIEFGFVQIIK